jgi:hypothetical protein
MALSNSPSATSVVRVKTPYDTVVMPPRIKKIVKMRPALDSGCVSP